MAPLARLFITPATGCTMVSSCSAWVTRDNASWTPMRSPLISTLAERENGLATIASISTCISLSSALISANSLMLSVLRCNSQTPNKPRKSGRRISTAMSFNVLMRQGLNSRVALYPWRA
ncbi:hypothetical protein D3C80_1563090 [compost metagenome]